MKAWIVGAGAFGRIVLDVLRATGRYSSICFVDDNAALHGTRINSAEIIGGLDQALAARCEGVEMIVAMGNPLERVRLGSLIVERGISLANAIHPSAVVMDTARLGYGNFIGAQAVVHTDARLGNHVIVNTAAIVEHDSIIEDGVAISPGAIVSGRVHLEHSSFLGAGATVTNRVRIGRGTVVGAGSMVARDLPENVLVLGNPARIIERIPDFDWKRVL